jgi:neuronal cell adhesion molecule
LHSYYIEETTLPKEALVVSAPDPPTLNVDIMPTDNGFAKAVVHWVPNLSGNHPGSHFYVQYRKNGETPFKNEHIFNQEFDEIGGLDADTNYEFRVVSVDGKFETASPWKTVQTPGSGKYLFVSYNTLVNYSVASFFRWSLYSST